MADHRQALKALNDSERGQLRSTLNLLFTESFLVRSIDNHASAYRFAVANFSLLEDYLEVSGWSLRKDELLGVVAFQGPPGARLHLSKDETIFLLILRLLFEEKAGEIALHGERTVRQEDIHEKYHVLAEASWKKTRYLSMLRRFQVLRLIRVVGPEADPESTVILYPSIPFALDGLAIEEAEARIKETAAGEEEGSGSSESPTADSGDDDEEGV